MRETQSLHGMDCTAHSPVRAIALKNPFSGQWSRLKLPSCQAGLQAKGMW